MGGPFGCSRGWHPYHLFIEVQCLRISGLVISVVPWESSLAILWMWSRSDYKQASLEMRLANHSEAVLREPGHWCEVGVTFDISRCPNCDESLSTDNSLTLGAAAPILGYGALNALLFVAYNRSLMAMESSLVDPTNPDGVPLYKIWIAGAAGGLASWSISSPTEFIKCRAQLDPRPEVSSWTVAKDIYRTRGLRGLYYGGAITSARDSIGYGF